MNKTGIVLIMLIAIVVGTFIATFTGASTSVSFDEAFENPGKEFKISGTLDKTNPVIYNPEEDTELTTFHMIDENNVKREVKLRKAKPNGLEQSEKVHLYGQFENGEFFANEMLMKCPSKYDENNHLLETAEASVQ